MQVQILTSTELDPLMDTATAMHCPTCGVTQTPDGLCFNLGGCFVADSQASRTASGQPRAWTLGGNVD